jgi:hypothetical protein
MRYTPVRCRTYRGGRFGAVMTQVSARLGPPLGDIRSIPPWAPPGRPPGAPPCNVTP